jgi:hypothetical protein
MRKKGDGLIELVLSELADREFHRYGRTRKIRKPAPPGVGLAEISTRRISTLSACRRLRRPRREGRLLSVSKAELATVTKQQMERTLELCQSIADWCGLVDWMQHPETKIELARERDEMVLELFRRVGLNYEQFGLFFR